MCSTNPIMSLKLPTSIHMFLTLKYEFLFSESPHCKSNGVWLEEILRSVDFFMYLSSSSHSMERRNLSILDVAQFLFLLVQIKFLPNRSQSTSLPSCSSFFFSSKKKKKELYLVFESLDLLLLFLLFPALSCYVKAWPMT